MTDKIKVFCKKHTTTETKFNKFEYWYCEKCENEADFRYILNDNKLRGFLTNYEVIPKAIFG